MKAIMQERFGSADTLELKEIAKPVPGTGEVLLRVHAAGVGAWDWHSMTGRPYLARAGMLGFRAPKVKVRGWDVAGTVESIGQGVTRFKPGDDVYGTARGSFAEFVCAKEDRIAPKPANLTFDQAAAVPTAAITALQGLRDKGGIRAGQHVLILGAGGGVGSFAVQIAKAYGAHVTGVCSTAKVDLVRSLGADEVIDYTKGDVLSLGQTYDIILDNGGNRSLASLRRILVPVGKIVLVGGEDGGPFWGGIGRNVQAAVQSLFMKQKMIGLVASERAEDLEVLTGHIEAGKVTPAIERTYPLEETAEAMRHWEERKVKGKVVVTV